MTAEREGLAEEISGVLVGQHFVIHDHTPPAIGEHLAISDKAASHLADALADLLAARDRRVRGEALRVASLDLDVPVRGTFDGVRVVRLIDVTAWLRDEAVRQEPDAGPAQSAAATEENRS